MNWLYLALALWSIGGLLIYGFTSVNLNYAYGFRLGRYILLVFLCGPLAWLVYLGALLVSFFSDFINP